MFIIYHYSVYIEFVRDEDYPANEFLISINNSLRVRPNNSIFLHFINPDIYSLNKQKETNPDLLRFVEL